MAKNKGVITFSFKGNYKKTYKFLNECNSALDYAFLRHIGEEGVRALASATPIDSGKTASSWEYHITTDTKHGTVSVEWHNTNVIDGHNVAILLQYGHQSKNGSWVYGTDYINPAIQPIFDKMADDLWDKVVSK